MKAPFAMSLWLIPMVYVAVSVAAGVVLPRIEQVYFPFYTLNLSVSSAQAYLSAAASGMMAMTGIVFAMAFVMVQFSAVAYSPRLVLWFTRDRILFHSLGAFAATFVYALFTLAWVDRSGAGTVPLISSLIVAFMLILSMLLFSRLVQRVNDLQISSVLYLIGNKGREVIREMFRKANQKSAIAAEHVDKARERTEREPAVQSLAYFGEPRSIARLDLEVLVRLAKGVDGAIVMTCAVGDTLIEGTAILTLYGAKALLSEKTVMRAIHLRRERTFEQDPKYPIRLLVDVAIRALSPAINDPTTAVQTLDQLEDLLHRLGQCDLQSGCVLKSEDGAIRLIVQMPTWDDYLSLAFDEIRQYGANSVQVVRRLRSVLKGLADALPDPARLRAVQRRLEHLDMMIKHSALDPEDRQTAAQEDRQGLGLSRA